MQTATYTVNSGGGVALWRGIPAQIEISGISDVSGNWLFLVDNNFSDGVILSGTVAADGETLVVTLENMNTTELKNAINGKPLLDKCRATLTDGVSRVYIIPLVIRNRAMDGQPPPTPVSEYYTKAQIDAIIAAIPTGTDDYTELDNKPAINGHTLTGDQTAAELGLATPADIPTVPVQSVNGQTGAVVLDAADVDALPAVPAIIVLTGTTVAPAHGAVYRHTLAASDAFTIPTTGLTAAEQLTFELHLIQPATAVAFTLPAGVMWADGDAFAAGNAAPTMNTANTLYCLVFRWDSVNLLGNLAYSKVVTA